MISMTVHVPKKLKTIHKKNDDEEVDDDEELEEELFDGEGNGIVEEDDDLKDDDLEDVDQDGTAKTSAPAVVAAKRKANNAVKESNLAEEDGEEDE